MRRLKFRHAVGALALASGAAQALVEVPMQPGDSRSVTLPGTTSIYQVFGHSGSANPPADDAAYLPFEAGSGRVFTFTSVTGGVNCCSTPSELNTPDGMIFSQFVILNPTTTVTGINGLSDAKGNTQLPLVGVFTTDTDPFGQTAPAALPAWNASAPTSLAPAMHQVFYIGDGRAGFNDAGGALLQFTAPVGATRLYLGFADAGNFIGTSGWYWDNPGSMSATVLLSAVPEPATWGLAVAGLALVGAAARRRAG